MVHEYFGTMKLIVVIGGFFRKCDSFFKSPKKIFQKTILSLKFKSQVQDIFLEYIYFFGDLEI